MLSSFFDTSSIPKYMIFFFNKMGLSLLTTKQWETTCNFMKLECSLRLENSYVSIEVSFRLCFIQKTTHAPLHDLHIMFLDFWSWMNFEWRKKFYFKIWILGKRFFQSCRSTRNLRNEVGSVKGVYLIISHDIEQTTVCGASFSKYL